MAHYTKPPSGRPVEVYRLDDYFRAVMSAAQQLAVATTRDDRDKARAMCRLANMTALLAVKTATRFLVGDEVYALMRPYRENRTVGDSHDFDAQTIGLVVGAYKRHVESEQAEVRYRSGVRKVERHCPACEAGIAHTECETRMEAA